MGQRRKAERSARIYEQAVLAGPFRSDALTLADVFPEPIEATAIPSGRLTAAACGLGLTLCEEGPGLLLTCTYNIALSSQPERGRDLTYAQVLSLIRAGGLVPTRLDLVLAPTEATGAWSLHQAERVTFSSGEWRLVGWNHWSESRIARAHERLARLGMEGSFPLPYLELRFQLTPKVLNVGRNRLLAARAVFERGTLAG